MRRDGSLPGGFSDLADLRKPVRIIGKDGKQLGIMSMSEAMKIAQAEAAELIAISPKSSPPVYRMIDSIEYQKLVSKGKRTDDE